MKKLVFTLMIFGAALAGLSSCGGGDQAAQDAATQAQEQEAARIDSLSNTLDDAADAVEEQTESAKKALEDL